MSTNRHPATCTRCRRRIDAGKGTLTGKVAGRWTAVHTGSCDESLPLPTPAPTVRVAPVPTWEAYRFERITTLIREAGDNVDAAFARYAEENEHWDGEPEITMGAKANFYRVAGEYLNHPDIREACAFAAREAEQEAAAYMAEYA